MSPLPSTFKGIREVFYETRVLRGREWTLRRFAAELGIDPVLLGYIEKGERFPNEALVRKLAKLSGEDPRELLAVLYRDRMVRAMAREIRRAIAGASAALDDDVASDDADESVPAVSFSVALSQAFATLPDDGSPVPLKKFRAAVNAALVDTFGKATRSAAKRIEDTLVQKKLVSVGARDVRKKGHHIHAAAPDERLDLALEFAAIFAKSLTDKIVRDRRATYLKNHFLLIPAEQLDAFRKRLDAAVTAVVQEYAAPDDSIGGSAAAARGTAARDFVRVLVAGTQKE